MTNWKRMTIEDRVLICESCINEHKEQIKFYKKAIKDLREKELSKK